MAYALNNLGTMYFELGKTDSALVFFKRSYSIREEIFKSTPEPGFELKEGLASCLNKIGMIQSKQGLIEIALDNFMKGLELREEINNSKGIAISLKQIGQVYLQLGDTKKALDYFNRALPIAKETGEKRNISSLYTEIAKIYTENAKDENLNPDSVSAMMDRALLNLDRSLVIYYETNDLAGLSSTFSLVGRIYYIKSKYNEAIENFEKSLKINMDLERIDGISYSLMNIGRIYFKMNDLITAEKYALNSMKYSKQVGYPDNIMCSASLLKDINLKKGNYEKAYSYSALENLMKDSLINEKGRQKLLEAEAKHFYIKQQIADSIRYAGNLKTKDIELDKNKSKIENQHIISSFLVVCFVISIVFSVLLLRVLKQRKKANEKLFDKNREMEVKNKEITDSINYAKRIQTAVLPSKKMLTDLLGEDHFLLYRPKDIVSGDFYWITESGDQLIICVADCTGHGVPGAFMSMLGMSFIDEIVRKKGINYPSEILEELRKDVIASLKQKEVEIGKKPMISMVWDGMDVSIISINSKTQICEFSGAMNSAYIIRDDKLIIRVGTVLQDAKLIDELRGHYLYELKADRQPIGSIGKMSPFTNTSLNLMKNDRLYLFSDGYADQFRGKTRKKMKLGVFRKLLLEICDKPMPDQGNALDDFLGDWRYHNGIIADQIDDITVLGLRIKHVDLS